MNNKKYPLYTMILAVAIFCFLCFFVGIWPLGEKTIVTGDLGGQYINFYAHYADVIKRGDYSGLLYSFNKSLGGPMIGNLAYYCTSVFNLAFIFFSSDKYPIVVTIIFAMKIVFASGTMCFFLNHKYDDIGLISVAISLCYAYSAFSVVYYQNVMWFDAMVCLPLITYGIDKIIKDGSSYIYIIFLAYAIMSNFYTGYMVCIFCVIYFLHEMVINTQKRKCICCCIDFGVSSLISGGLSAFLVIPMLADVLKAKGSGGGFSFTGLPAFKFTEFFYRLFPFNFTWGDVHEGLPNVYTGTLCLIGIAVFFSLKNVRIKEKIASLWVLVVLFFSMYSYDFMLLWHGFKKPVWFPYRNTFVFSFFLCMITAKAFQYLKLSAGTILCTGSILLILTITAFLVRNIWFTLTLLCVGLVFMAVQRIALLAVKTVNYKKIGLFLMLIVCITELSSNAIFNIKQFENYTINYLSDFYFETDNLLNNITEDDLYHSRVEKTFYRTYNDPMMFGYPGISHFGSTEDTETNHILNVLGYDSQVYSGNTTAFADSFIGIKYLMTKEKISLPAHFNNYHTYDNGIIASNDFVFPMLFRADPAINKDFFPSNNTFITQNELYKMLGGSGELFTIATDEIDINEQGNITLSYEDDFFYYLSEYNNEAEEIKYDCSPVVLEDKVVFNRFMVTDISDVKVWKMKKSALSELSQTLWKQGYETDITSSGFVVDVDCQQDGTYIINLPYTEFLKITVDGEKADIKPVLCGLTSVYLNKGNHTIEAGAEIIGGYTGLIITVLSYMALIVYNKNKNKY